MFHYYSSFLKFFRILKKKKVKLAHVDLVEKGDTSEEAFWNMYFECKFRDRFSTGPPSAQQQKPNIFDDYEEKYLKGNFPSPPPLASPLVNFFSGIYRLWVYVLQNPAVSLTQTDSTFAWVTLKKQ